jgi:hypothetical protein
MNIGQIYASRKDFVESGIKPLMKAKQDFQDLRYARSSITNREYIRITDITGKALTLDITGDSLEKILMDASRIILMGEEKVHAPTGTIIDMEVLRKIAPLFQ